MVCSDSDPGRAVIRFESVDISRSGDHSELPWWHGKVDASYLSTRGLHRMRQEKARLRNCLVGPVRR